MIASQSSAFPLTLMFVHCKCNLLFYLIFQQPLIGTLLAWCLTWLNTYGSYVLAHVSRVLHDQTISLAALEAQVENFLNFSTDAKNFQFVKVMEVFHSFSILRDDYKLKAGPIQRTLAFLKPYGFVLTEVGSPIL